METLTSQLIADIKQESAGQPYPVYAKKLREAGIDQYEVNIEVPAVTFRQHNGEEIRMSESWSGIRCEDTFEQEDVKKALERVQLGITDYVDFLKEIAAAGVHTYLADLTGMKVIYRGMGAGESYTETIPEPDTFQNKE
jgi:uncharacterized protein YbcV (DUF1398 family)